MEFVSAKNIVYTQKLDWFGCDYNMNIYKGCSHECIYCDSRSDCYHVENFSTVRAKKDSTEIITKNLISKRKKGVVGTGAMSDPYNPFEEKYMLTRKALEAVNNNGFGIMITTKSDLILRDIDILKKIQAHSPVLVCITITSALDELSKIIEPNVCVSSKRFLALKELRRNKIPCCVFAMPILPFITDSKQNILDLVNMSHEARVEYIYASLGVTLRDGQRKYYYEKIDELFDGLSDRYIKTYGDRYNYPCFGAKKLYAEFKAECKKYNIITSHKEITNAYKKGYGFTQLSWF